MYKLSCWKVEQIDLSQIWIFWILRSLRTKASCSIQEFEEKKQCRVSFEHSRQNTQERLRESEQREKVWEIELNSCYRVGEKEKRGGGGCVCPPRWWVNICVCVCVSGDVWSWRMRQYLAVALKTADNSLSSKHHSSEHFSCPSLIFFIFFFFFIILDSYIQSSVIYHVSGFDCVGMWIPWADRGELQGPEVFGWCWQILGARPDRRFLATGSC